MTPNDVKTVAENINDFIEVSDGIDRLRNAVLTLAVSGLLVEQSDTDEDVDDLIAQIELEREDSSNLKRKSKTHPVVSRNEVFFDIPKSWRWVPFGSLFIDYGSGSTPSRGSDKYYAVEGFNWYKSGELNDSTLPTEASEKVTEIALKECRLRVFHPGDFLIAMYGATAGRISISAGTGTTNQAVWSGTPSKKIESRYLYYYLLQSRQILIDKSSGAAQPNISGEKILAHPFALPPLAEQKRIVKKVDEVMSQLDELESQKNKRDSVRSRFTRSAMQALVSNDSKIAFNQLTELIKTPQDIKELENAILTLAVSGNLVPQDEKEKTAEELYTEVQSEINKNLKGKKPQVLDVTEDEIPFEIPESWRWVRLIEIGKLDTGKTPRTGVAGNYGGEIPFIGPGDVQNGTINSYSKLVTEQGAAESKFLYPGDVLMVCIGGTIGKSAYVNGTYTFNQQINKITPFHVDGRFLSFVFITEFFQKLVWGKASGGATPLVNLTRWSSCIVPLPPLAEQKRIVKKVEELMVLVTQLKEVIGTK